MKEKKALLIVALVFVLLIGGAGLLYNAFKDNVNMGSPVAENGNTAEKELAPDFTVIDAEGNSVKLSDFRGKPVVLNFWASWCGPCKYEMPDFNEQYALLGDEVEFLMVNLTDGARETVDTAKKFIADNGYTFPVYFDTNSEAVLAYGAYSIPATYFIDAEGYGVAYARGAIDKDVLLQGIDMIR